MRASPADSTERRCAPAIISNACSSKNRFEDRATYFHCFTKREPGTGVLRGPRRQPLLEMLIGAEKSDRGTAGCCSSLTVGQVIPHDSIGRPGVADSLSGSA